LERKTADEKMRRLRRKEGVEEWRQEKRRYDDRGECMGSGE
jgi:hypothetical protein